MRTENSVYLPGIEQELPRFPASNMLNILTEISRFLRLKFEAFIIKGVS
jgi:hypothetical protein